jgi:hypothetical protein
MRHASASEIGRSEYFVKSAPMLGASVPPLLCRDELQPAPDDLLFGLPGQLFQLVESSPLFFAETGMNVRLHLITGAQL